MVKTRVFTYKRKEKIEKIYGGKLVKVRAHLLGAKKKKKKERIMGSTNLTSLMERVASLILLVEI